MVLSLVGGIVQRKNLIEYKKFLKVSLITAKKSKRARLDLKIKREWRIKTKMMAKEMKLKRRSIHWQLISQWDRRSLSTGIGFQWFRSNRSQKEPKWKWRSLFYLKLRKKRKKEWTTRSRKEIISMIVTRIWCFMTYTESNMLKTKKILVTIKS